MLATINVLFWKCISNSRVLLVFPGMFSVVEAPTEAILFQLVKIDIHEITIFIINNFLQRSFRSFSHLDLCPSRKIVSSEELPLVCPFDTENDVNCVEDLSKDLHSAGSHLKS